MTVRKLEWARKQLGLNPDFSLVKIVVDDGSENGSTIFSRTGESADGWIGRMLSRCKSRILHPIMDLMVLFSKWLSVIFWYDVLFRFVFVSNPTIFWKHYPKHCFMNFFLYYLYSLLSLLILFHIMKCSRITFTLCIHKCFITQFQLNFHQNLLSVDSLYMWYLSFKLRTCAIIKL